MSRLIKIYDMTDGLGETALTGASVIIATTAQDALGLIVLTLAAFFWAIRIKREIQQQFHGKVCESIKSLFKKWYNYGGDGKGKD